MEEMRMMIDGRPLRFYPAEMPGAPLVVVNGETGEGGALREAVRVRTSADWSLAALEELRWGDDLTPWPVPPFSRHAEPCTGGADAYLTQLTEHILPQLKAQLPTEPAWVGLAGYSLAGLFAVYAMYRTDAFARVASVSGSLWYPGLMAYAENHAPVRAPERLYLSLGDREARTRNAAMKPVEDNTRRLAELCRERGIPLRFEMNPGGHFDQPAERMAKALTWLLEP